MRDAEYGTTNVYWWVSLTVDNVRYSTPFTEGPAMHELPMGTVTFLFTEIKGNTKLWEQPLAAMGPTLARHDPMLKGEGTAS